MIHSSDLKEEIASLERLVRHAASKLEKKDIDTASMALESALGVIDRLRSRVVTQYDQHIIEGLSLFAFCAFVPFAWSLT